MQEHIIIIYIIAILSYWVWLLLKFINTNREIKQIYNDPKLNRPIQVIELISKYLFNTGKRNDYVVRHYKCKNLNTLGKIEFLSEENIEIKEFTYRGIFDQNDRLLFIVDDISKKSIKTLIGREYLDFSLDILVSSILGMSGFVVLSGHEDLQIITKMVILCVIFLLWTVPTIIVGKKIETIQPIDNKMRKE